MPAPPQPPDARSAGDRAEATERADDPLPDAAPPPAGEQPPELTPVVDPASGHPPETAARRRTVARTGLAALTLGALGVVFGDIGTSPLYALQTVFTADHRAVHTSAADVYGVISLVFWSITMVVSVKYVIFIMRADNDGEGGIMALTALVQRARVKQRDGEAARWSRSGILGASLFYGDGMITPAISVLSAVEGVKVAVPSLHSLVLPITVAVLTRAVRDPALRHEARRQPVRPGDGRVVRRARR